MTDAGFQDGEVVWAPDPYSGGSNPRLWLILATGSLPYAGEEYLCAALTTSDLPDNFEVGDAGFGVAIDGKRRTAPPGSSRR